jgi:type I site-specific restriction-modification system R (restriction) subunit
LSCSAAAKYAQNRITFRPHTYFGDANHEVDFVFYLNGLPIVTLELKHEANQNEHEAVGPFAKRDHAKKIFQHPFLYLAADTTDAMAATDPRKEENFRCHNMGLTNTPTNADEYPVEYLYREMLSQDQLLGALSFFLVRVPEREAEEDKPARPASTIFPRYHQSRLVRRVAEDITAPSPQRATSAKNIWPTIPPAAAKRCPSAGWPTGCTASSSPARTRSWWTSPSSRVSLSRLNEPLPLQIKLLFF